MGRGARPFLGTFGPPLQAGGVGGTVFGPVLGARSGPAAVSQSGHLSGKKTKKKQKKRCFFSKKWHAFWFSPKHLQKCFSTSGGDGIRMPPQDIPSWPCRGFFERSVVNGQFWLAQLTHFPWAHLNCKILSYHSCFVIFDGFRSRARSSSRKCAGQK